LLGSCIGKHNSDASKATVSAKKHRIKALAQRGHVLKFDLSKSYYSCRKKLKMRGTGKHEGKIELKKCVILSQTNEQLGPW